MFLGILVLFIFTYDFIVKNNDLSIGIPINQPVFHGMFKLDTVLYLSWRWLTRKTTSEVRPTRDFRCAWILRSIAMECLWWWFTSLATLIEHDLTRFTGVYDTGWWVGTWILFFHIYWEFHHPNWRTHIFQRVETTNQDRYFWSEWVLKVVCPIPSTS